MSKATLPRLRESIVQSQLCIPGGQEVDEGQHRDEQRTLQRKLIEPNAGSRNTSYVDEKSDSSRETQNGVYWVSPSLRRLAASRQAARLNQKRERPNRLQVRE